MREAKPPTDQAAVSKQFLDLIGIGVRDDVEVLRVPIEQQIADSAAHEKALEARTLQSIQNLEGVGRDMGPADVVFRARDDDETVARL
jgi:aminopeptidase C